MRREKKLDKNKEYIDIREIRGQPMRINLTKQKREDKDEKTEQE